VVAARKKECNENDNEWVSKNSFQKGEEEETSVAWFLEMTTKMWGPIASIASGQSPAFLRPPFPSAHLRPECHQCLLLEFLLLPDADDDDDDDDFEMGSTVWLFLETRRWTNDEGY